MSLGLCLLASVYELVAAVPKVPRRGPAAAPLAGRRCGAARPGHRGGLHRVVRRVRRWSPDRSSAFCVVTLSLGAGLSVLRVPALRRRAGRRRLHGVRPVDRRGRSRRSDCRGAGHHQDRAHRARPPRCRRCWRPWRRPESRGRRTCGPATPSTAASTGVASTPCGSVERELAPGGSADVEGRAARRARRPGRDPALRGGRCLGDRGRPGAETSAQAIDIVRHGAVTARLQFDPSRDRPRRGLRGGHGRGRGDRQPRASRRAGPAGRAGDRVPHPDRDRAPRRADDGSSVTSTTGRSSTSSPSLSSSSPHRSTATSRCSARRWTGRWPSSG